MVDVLQHISYVENLGTTTGHQQVQNSRTRLLYLLCQNRPVFLCALNQSSPCFLRNDLILKGETHIGSRRIHILIISHA